MKRIALAGLVLLWVCAGGCGTSGPPLSPSEVLVVRQAALPSDLQDAAWSGAPLHAAALILQDMVEPRLLAPSTPEIRVQAITDGARVAFRLSWTDTASDDVQAPARFADACAVQLPSRIERDLPAPQMGEPGRPVEISYWRASWQAVVDGRKDRIEEIYPGAAVGHYPFEAGSLAPGSPEQEAMARRY